MELKIRILPRFLEGLRKWPAAPHVDRQSVKSYIIEPQNRGEKPAHLPAGSICIIPILGVHRDPNYYANPEKFDPERFSYENRKNINPLTYMPFGSGPRNCIGLPFLLRTKHPVNFVLPNI